MYYSKHIHERLPQCSFGVKAPICGAIPNIQRGSLVNVSPLVFCLALEASLAVRHGTVQKYTFGEE